MAMSTNLMQYISVIESFNSYLSSTKEEFIMIYETASNGIKEKVDKVVHTYKAINELEITDAYYFIGALKDIFEEETFNKKIKVLCEKCEEEIKENFN